MRPSDDLTAELDSTADEAPAERTVTPGEQPWRPTWVPKLGVWAWCFIGLVAAAIVGLILAVTKWPRCSPRRALRLSEEKTRVCHIDEGFDFLGWRIQRRNRRGRNGKRAVYTDPSKKALAWRRR